MFASNNLLTNRLFIRPFKISDLSSFESIVGDPDTMQFIGGPLQPAEAKIQLQRWIADFERDGFGFMAFIDNDVDILLGYGGFLMQIVDGQKYMELGYVIAKSHWGQGLGTEAAFALKEYGLHILRIPELISIVHEKNTASLRISSKIRMSHFKNIEIDQNPYQIYFCKKCGHI